jgi:hypothetical protein
VSSGGAFNLSGHEVADDITAFMPLGWSPLQFTILPSGEVKAKLGDQLVVNSKWTELRKVK